MDDKNKRSWIDKIFGLNLKEEIPSSIVLQRQNNLLSQQLSTLERFSNVIGNQIGVTALWNDGTYSGNVQGYSTNGMLYSIVSRIAKTAAVVPFRVYRIKNNAKHLRYKQWTGENATAESLQRSMIIKNLTYEQDDTHPLNKLIERPNAWQNGSEYIINCIGFKLLTGNRFVYLNTLDSGADAGLPFEIYNLPPQYMSVVSDGSLYGVSQYRFNMGVVTEVPAENIIHNKYFNPEFDRTGSHLLGLSPLRAANRTVTRSDSAVERSTAYLKNAGSPGALVNEDASDDMSPEQVLNMMNDINKRVRGTNNAGKITGLNGKWNYLNFGMTSTDMQILETERYTNEQLCNIYSVPPGLFNPDKATYANSKEFKKELITGAVIPELSSQRDDWNQIAARYKDKNVYVDYDLSVYPELQDDLEKTARILSFAWWFTGNEKRIISGQDEDIVEPMMNTYLVPSGNVTIESLSNNMQDMANQIDIIGGGGVNQDPNAA